MRIAIVNDVHVGKPLMYGDQIRASSNRIMDKFEPFLRSLIIRHKPDLLINLGDLIRSESKDIDLIMYQVLIETYKSLKLPVIHLLGNHEIKQLEVADIEAIWKRCEFDQNSYGCRSFGDFDILWLGISKHESGIRKFLLPPDQLSWLKLTLALSSKPTLIFLHTPVDDHDVNGNFFYEALDDREKHALFLANQAELREIIQSRKNIIAVFQAHLHYFHARIMGGIPYITCPAMSDNICGPDVVDNIPEIYTVVNIDKQQLTVKAYSREFCFAGYEQSLLI